MWMFKSNLEKLTIQYNKYFGQKDKIKDYLDLKKKTLKQLRAMSNLELENLRIKLDITTTKKQSSWDNYVALRLANIAIAVSVITTLFQYYPDLLKYGHICLIVLLIMGSLFLYSFSYRDERNEDWQVFFSFLLTCVDEILASKNKKRKT